MIVEITNAWLPMMLDSASTECELTVTKPLSAPEFKLKLKMLKLVKANKLSLM